MRTSKYLGFLAIGFGAVLLVGAAVLPVSPSSERFGPFRVNVRGDSCGPAGIVAFEQDSNSECRTAARKRLLSTSAVGLLILAIGMALFAGGDGTNHSRIAVTSPRVKRRSLVGSRGSRRYKPG